jgi:hypothetical protein
MEGLVQRLQWQGSLDDGLSERLQSQCAGSDSISKAWPLPFHCEATVATPLPAVLDNMLKYSITPIIRTLVFRIANYTDRLGPSGNFVENSTKLICFEITSYRTDTSLNSSSKSVSHFLTVIVLHLFYGLNFSPICQIYTRNYVLIFYLYVNKHVAYK